MKLSGIDRVGKKPADPEAVFQDTPEKFQSAAREPVQALTALLRELAALENKSFAQYTRLYKKGRVIEFKDGVRTEFTDIQAWKEERKLRFAALLDPHCTQKMLAQRRDCLHAQHFPSSFNCVDTGCQMIVTMKSAGKAVIQLIPHEGSVPFDLSDPDVRYLVEHAKHGGHSAQCYGYFQKYRFVLKRQAEEWHIDEASCDSLHGDRWRRDYYF